MSIKSGNGFYFPKIYEFFSTLMFNQVTIIIFNKNLSRSKKIFYFAKKMKKNIWSVNMMMGNLTIEDYDQRINDLRLEYSF
jgi:serine kinase of HPr protein (carbohydrate metabolism regulator)